ncbi:MAG: DUF1553 domain-containing protein [Isosphaeraceae bacterium]
MKTRFRNVDPSGWAPGRCRRERRAGAALFAVLCVLPIGTARAAEKLEYNRDIRPILAENCFACHGPDSAARKADLRLDQREAAIAAGALKPGDPDESELIARVNSSDADEVMPPPSLNKTLTARQKDLLTRWVKEGGEYQLHWSLIAPSRPPLPRVKDEAWVRNPIDRFILAGLEQAGLRPAPEADRRTLARRLSLDLTGLPPEPAAVEALVNDRSPDAYAKYVDHLLESPRWGEHRARYWLDAARYADTHGYHFDNFREMWTYRDWVIGAFNRNMRFDRFTVEQLAGDLLPDRTLDQQVASGFNRCNMTTNEGGTIPEENLVNYTRDRTETVSQVWLGLTANCAVCHDHKFDPLTQREFYEMSAFFNNSTQGAMDGNIHDTPPTVFVPGLADRDRWPALRGELDSVRKEIEARTSAARPGFEKWLAGQNPDQLRAQMPQRELRLGASLASREGDRPAPSGPLFESADSGDFERNNPFSFGAWIRLPKAGLFGAVVARMDNEHDARGWDLWLEDGRVATHIVNKWPDNGLKVVTRTQVPVNQWTHVFITYDGTSQAAGVKIYIDGKPQAVDIAANQLNNTIRTAVPLKVGQRHSSDRLEGVGISELRVHRQALTPGEVTELLGVSRTLALLGKPEKERSKAEVDAVLSWWLETRDPGSKELQARLAALQKEEQAIRSRGTVAHVMQERSEMPMAYILYRGEYDKRRDQVKPDTPDVLPPLGDLPRNRLGFAKWLLRPEHPLTARVTVNRFWQEVFGSGLVRTAGDFGVSGELPSHPELLDWLAVEFRESGWDVKRFFKLLVTSAAYRQSAAATPEKVEKDPQNRLLSRGPRFRMDGEVIRDYALAASGLMVDRLGGPSVKPYQPDGVWEAVAMPESNTKKYVRDRGENLYRRSLYTFWKRSAPPASLEVFNAPSREVCTVRRERTNTPLQALETLNDPQFVEAARGLAQLALARCGDSADGRIDFIARRLLARSLRPEELQVIRASADRLVAYYQSHPEDAARLLSVGELPPCKSSEPAQVAAWTMLANELMNLDEVLNK